MWLTLFWVILFLTIGIISVIAFCSYIRDDIENLDSDEEDKDT